MFFPLFSKVFNNILKIYELPKIHNKIPKFSQTLFLPVVMYKANSMPHLHLKMSPRAQRFLLVLNFKKPTVDRTFF